MKIGVLESGYLVEIEGVDNGIVYYKKDGKLESSAINRVGLVTLENLNKFMLQAKNHREMVNETSLVFGMLLASGIWMVTLVGLLATGVL